MSERSFTVIMTRKQIPIFLLASLTVLFIGRLKIKIEDDGSLTDKVNE